MGFLSVFLRVAGGDGIVRVGENVLINAGGVFGGELA
jgi:hypothetical protein